MSHSVAILGRQPAIGLAELESLFGADKLTPIGAGSVVIDIPLIEIPFGRLGGTVKLAKLLTIMDTTDWEKLEDYLIEHLPQHVCCIPEGKLTLGLSCYGFNISVKRLNATALTLKKVVRDTDRPCRIVPNNELALSSAQVLHNKLYTSHNWELILIAKDSQTYLAQTTNVQDIDAYAARDQVRPKRDAKVGMLPPKLAQIIINLGVGRQPSENSHGLDVALGSQEERVSRTSGTVSERQTPADTAIRQEQERITGSASKQVPVARTILDPFCGTGVVLQESLLMGYGCLGSDLDERMVEFTSQNLAWLQHTNISLLCP